MSGAAWGCQAHLDDGVGTTLERANFTAPAANERANHVVGEKDFEDLLAGHTLFCFIEGEVSSAQSQSLQGPYQYSGNRAVALGDTDLQHHTSQWHKPHSA